MVAHDASVVNGALRFVVILAQSLGEVVQRFREPVKSGYFVRTSL